MGNLFKRMDGYPAVGRPSRSRSCPSPLTQPSSPSILTRSQVVNSPVRVWLSQQRRQDHGPQEHQWLADMPHRSTVFRSIHLKMRFSTRRPIRITVTRPAKTRSVFISKRFW